MIDTACLRDLFDEVTAAIETAEDVRRGLEKYLRLPLRLGTLAEVEGLQARYERRIGLVRTLARALADTLACAEAVLEDGYPSLPVGEVSLEVSNDLDEHLADIRHTQASVQLTRIRVNSWAANGD